ASATTEAAAPVPAPTQAEAAVVEAAIAQLDAIPETNSEAATTGETPSALPASDAASADPKDSAAS
ncbi:MAG: hypothetical protein IJC63_02820, partial [Myxococcaceae bacterium]|nr:hypothetical protein [Myxococcaceae bacterium]